MFDDHALRTMVYKAIRSYPPRFNRTWRADTAEPHRAEGAYRAYLQCITLAPGGHYPMGNASPEATAAWRAVHDAVDTVLRQAASTLDEPDDDAAMRAVHAVADTHGLTPQQPASRPVSMQERILAALTEVGRRAGHQVNIQPEYANTGRVYYTAKDGFALLVELSYQFHADNCLLHLQGPAIEALSLQDSPPQFRYERAPHGWRLSYYALRYADGDRITAMLDLLTQALTAGTRHA
jgi:hypothetical protein